MRILFFASALAVATLLHAAPEYPNLGPDIYDTKADGAAQIAAALQRAKAEHKHVLLVFGANWCIWCHRLHDTMEKNDRVSGAVRKNYEVVLVDVNTRRGEKRNAAVDEKYGFPTKNGLPVLMVLDAAGKPLVTQDSGELEDGKDAHDPAKIVAFLEQWKPAK